MSGEGEARQALIEGISRADYEWLHKDARAMMMPWVDCTERVRESFRARATNMLDAALACEIPGPCGHCGGTGEEPPKYDRPCVVPDCTNGTRSVSALGLLLAAQEET